jgi:ammonia channel protein AmtB
MLCKDFDFTDEAKDLLSRHPETLSAKELNKLIDMMQQSINTLKRNFHISNIVILFQVFLLIVCTKLLTGNIVEYISIGLICVFIVLFSYKSYNFFVPFSVREYLKYLKTLLPQNQ